MRVVSKGISKDIQHFLGTTGGAFTGGQAHVQATGSGARVFVFGSRQQFERLDQGPQVVGFAAPFTREARRSPAKWRCLFPGRVRHMVPAM